MGEHCEPQSDYALIQRTYMNYIECVDDRLTKKNRKLKKKLKAIKAKFIQVNEKLNLLQNYLIQKELNS